MNQTLTTPPLLVRIAARFHAAPAVPCSTLELNNEQLRAVQATEGALLVLSGAGTGKTRTITHRIAHIITEHGIAPNRILAVTFTNRAALEMKARVLQLLSISGVRDSTAPILCTFHSLGARLLRRYVEELGKGITRSFSIYDQSDTSRLITVLLKEADFAPELAPAAVCADRIGVAKNSGLSADEFSRTVAPRDETAAAVAHIYTMYEARLRSSNAVDLDDLLLLSVQLLRTRPEVRQRLAGHFQYILVDEYQDTNTLQLELIKDLASVHHNLCAVGDEDQSIYTWRGAVLSNTLDFQRHFPGADIIRLEENYRSTPQIIAAASRVISNNRERLGKQLWTRRRTGVPVRLYEAMDGESEAEFVAERIRDILTNPPDELPAVGVLYRTNTQARLIEEALRERGIPHIIAGGLSFYARAEIKDVMSYVRLVANSDDRAAFERAIAKPSRGIGAKAIAALFRLADRRRVGLWVVVKAEVDAFSGLSGRPESGLSRTALEALAVFYRHIEYLRRLGARSDISGLINSVIDDSNYGERLRQKGGEEAAARLRRLGELIESAGQYNGKAGALNDFIDHAALVAAADEEPDQAPAPVLLATIHAAKGLEFPYVFLLGLEERLFPHSRSLDLESGIEEERRLCYVALTRARIELTLSYARRRRMFTRWTECEPSRFLNEIPPELLFVDNGFGAAMRQTEYRHVSGAGR